MIGKRNAIIITGLARCLSFNKKDLLRICGLYDVFFVTNKNENTDNSLLKKMKSVYYIDDNDYTSMMEQHLLSIPEGNKILQWQKLKVGKEIIIAYERKKNIKYDTILKLRTDLKINQKIEFPDCKENTIYMNSDYYFCAKRDVFFQACDFFDRVSSYYNNFKYLPVNTVENILKSDIKCAKFQWLNYPKSSNINKLKVKDLSVEKITETFISHTEEEIESFNFRSYYRGIIFPSEPAFLHYLLTSGITVKELDRFNFHLLKNRSGLIANILDKIYDSFFVKNFDLSKYNLNNEHADFFKNLSLSYENYDVEKSFNLMLIANRIRPKGPFINKKIDELREKLNEKTNN